MSRRVSSLASSSEAQVSFQGEEGVRPGTVVSQESGLLGPCRGVFPSYLAAVAAIDVAVSETAVNAVIATSGAGLCCYQGEEGGESRIRGELDYNPSPAVNGSPPLISERHPRTSGHYRLNVRVEGRGS